VLVTNPVTFTATVASAVGKPTASVSFYDGTTLLGSVVLVSGTAAYTTSSLAVATHSITAVYAGDSTFGSVTSSALAQVVQDYTLTFSGSGSGGSGSGSGGSSSQTPSQTVVPGGTATYTLALGPSNGATFPTPVTLSISGIPPGATATISPQVLPAGSSLTSVTLSIQLPSVTSKAAPSPLGSGPLPLALAVLLLPFASRLRKVAGKLNRMLLFALLIASGIAGVASLSGCSGGSTGFFGQAQNTYVITITATSGNVHHSTSVNLTVQ
jgi:hypothetical protein